MVHERLDQAFDQVHLIPQPGAGMPRRSGGQAMELGGPVVRKPRFRGALCPRNGLNALLLSMNAQIGGWAPLLSYSSARSLMTTVAGQRGL